MTIQPNRLPEGGRIDRSQVHLVTFDGRQLLAHPGDTLASTMLANDELTVARSFKYHRPRGVMSAGSEETNALVGLRKDGRTEPNTPAPRIEAFDGLQASGQNAWPNVRLDIGAINQLFGPALAAGFYYKTFMGPVIGPLKGTRFWMFCEHVIRRAAGMGKATYLSDPDSYEVVNAHCDVLVVGGGLAGLAAAEAAAQTGADVILADEDFELGGSLLSEPTDGESDTWLAARKERLLQSDNVQVLSRTTVFGAYDNNVYGAVERCSDHLSEPRDHQVRQRYWRIRTKQCILASGAIERPLVFGGNDKPGVFLASALRTYLNRFAVLPGREVVIATNNDSAYLTAIDVAHAGARVTLLDTRSSVPEALSTALAAANVELELGRGLLAAHGRGRVKSATVGSIDSLGRLQGTGRVINCSVIGMSGGWSPTLHLWSHPGRKPTFNSSANCFVPEPSNTGSLQCVGAAAGHGAIDEIVSGAANAGKNAGEAARAAGSASTAHSLAPPSFSQIVDWSREPARTSIVTNTKGETKGKAFVDFQHDVTLSDIDLAHLEGFISVEHLKRYTTSGMAIDQGKTSNFNALSRMAQRRQADIEATGTTTFRPPYTPVSFGAIVGHETGPHFAPTRHTALHQWHVDQGASMIDAGAWVRPRYYPRGGEGMDEAYRREAAHVREHVGMVDVSTLGKIAVQGPDAAEFLNRVYVNGWKTLAIGRLRYGIMLREDGFVMDDGATARLGEHDYLMSTTTTNAGPVLAHLEYLLQVAWPDLKVHVTSVTDQWAAIAVAGPKSRQLLQDVVTGADLSATGLPNNHFVLGEINGVDVRVHRMSYSGELAYEVYVVSGHGLHVWQALESAGAPHELIPYGTESMGTLRIEKGHIAGPEIDGRTTLQDLMLEKFASSKKPFIGSVLCHRTELSGPHRESLVGLEIVGDVGAKPGMLLFPRHGDPTGHGDGFVSSTTYAPALNKYIALGLLKNGRERQGEVIRCIDFLSDQTLEAKVVSHHFFDPEGERQNG
ncbi:MAG: sarcosine oxidase subunit alpha family protein [Pseudomonadota bacterium]